MGADLSKISTADLEALAGGKLQEVSDSGLQYLHESAAPQPPTAGSYQPAGAANFSDSEKAAMAQLQGWADRHKNDTVLQKLTGSLDSDSPSKGNPVLSNLGPSTALGTALAGSLAGRMAASGTVGGVAGATQPAQDNTQRAMNTLKGVGYGLAGQGLAEGVGALASATGLPDAMQGKAEERAFKSAGAMLKDYRKAAGQDRINTLGRYMIENGLTKAGMTYGDVADGAQALVDQHGEAIGGILDQLDHAGAAAPTHEGMASKIEAQAAPLKDLSTARPTYNALADVASDIRTMGKGADSSFKSAQKVKEFISDQIDKAGGWTAPNPTEKNLALRDAYRMVNGEIEGAADSAAQSVGDSALLKNYQNQKVGYRNSLEITKIAKDQALRQNANRFLSPSDYGAAATGALAGAAMGGDSTEDKIKHVAIGAGLGLANKAMRTYGTPLVSTALDQGGAFLARGGLPALAQGAAPVVLAAAGGGMSGAEIPSAAARSVADTQAKSTAPSAPFRGPDAWAQNGMIKLGIQDSDLANRLLSDPRAVELLHQASNYAPGSKALKQIQTQIQSKWGSK